METALSIQVVHSLAAHLIVASWPQRACMLAEDGVNEINERVQAWRFSFSSEDSKNRLKAIRSAANFIEQHPDAFPGGRVPSDPATIAVLAIKVHSVFLSSSSNAIPTDIANAIVAASRSFEEGRS